MENEITVKLAVIIKYIPLQQGLRQRENKARTSYIIKYIPLQQGLRLL